jgi:hypothetical protein
MAKRWRKQKAETQHKKKRKPTGIAGSGDASQAHGTLGGFRSFTKSLFGGGSSTKPKTPLAKAIDMALWVAVAVLLYYVVSRQCMR